MLEFWEEVKPHPRRENAVLVGQATGGGTEVRRGSWMLSHGKGNCEHCTTGRSDGHPPVPPCGLPEWEVVRSFYFLEVLDMLKLSEDSSLNVSSVSVIEASESLKFSCLSSDPLSILGYTSETYHYSSGYMMLFQLTLENCSTFFNSLCFVSEASTKVCSILICVYSLIYILASKTKCIIYIYVCDMQK